MLEIAGFEMRSRAVICQRVTKAGERCLTERFRNKCASRMKLNIVIFLLFAAAFYQSCEDEFAVLAEMIIPAACACALCFYAQR